VIHETGAVRHGCHGGDSASAPPSKRAKVDSVVVLGEGAAGGRASLDVKSLGLVGKASSSIHYSFVR